MEIKKIQVKNREYFNLTNIGKIKEVKIDRTHWVDGVSITTQDNFVFTHNSEKPLYRLLGYCCVEQNIQCDYCTDPRFIRLCVILAWMYNNKKVTKILRKNFPNVKFDGKYLDVDFVNEIFLREANKDKTTYEEAQRWCDVNLIKFDPEMELIKDERREEYLYDFGTLIEEPKGWYFGK